jgi:Ca-activated chloride channel family protein
VIILLSDGENNENPDPMDAAKAAADRGVRIYTVGIGSPAGANVHVDGYTIHTQLDQTTLQQISQLTGGSYYNADSEEDLRAIYDSLTPQLVVKADKMEITPLFAGASIFVLLIGGMISLLWFGRMP